MSIKYLQTEQAVWSERNFGKHDYHHPLMGVVEEVGELHHAILKQEQGIRGTHAEHEEAAKDAVGDIVIYLADVCTCRGWDMAEIIQTTWARVKLRDWRKERVASGQEGE